MFRESAAKGIKDQVAIGWEAAFKGFLVSVKWRCMASIGMYDQALQPHEGRRIQSIRLILKAFHKFTQLLWTAQNKELHGSQDVDTKRIRDTETVEIIDLHGHRNSYLRVIGILWTVTGYIIKKSTVTMTKKAQT